MMGVLDQRDQVTCQKSQSQWWSWNLHPDSIHSLSNCLQWRRKPCTEHLKTEGIQPITCSRKWALFSLRLGNLTGDLCICHFPRFSESQRVYPELQGETDRGWWTSTRSSPDFSPFPPACLRPPHVPLSVQQYLCLQLLPYAASKTSVLAVSSGRQV